ncbi:NUDIX hydrolase domain-like protein [Tricladium varicosporioides]|nr:NUDIX hydrolase domain-like protein [Hymenoscyphus varicosporioides]
MPLPPPSFNFTFHHLLEPFNVPSQTYLTTHPSPLPSPRPVIATGALVFSSPSPSSPELKILLLQRALHDTLPGRWEVPGGGCDDDDPSILHGVARELYEEAGLKAVRMEAVVGEEERFVSSRGMGVRKFNFLVGVKEGEGVVLDENEHQNYVWASESEFKEGRVGSIQLVFTTEKVRGLLVEGFRIAREGKGKVKSESKVAPEGGNGA